MTVSQFKIKNLLIQVLPATTKQGLGNLDEGCTSPCSLNLTNYTQDCCAGGCSNVPSGACFPRSILFTVAALANGLVDPIDLAILKAQLQAALQEVEIRERVVGERLRVHTSEQAVELQKELSAALDELNALKGRLPSEKDAKK